MNKENAPHMHLISCLVEDKPGVLSRISGMFTNRGFNIDSLAVGRTQVAGVSRISLVCGGDDRVIGQIINQLNKLVDVIRVSNLTWEDHVESEMMLVKVGASESKQKIEKICGEFHARVRDEGPQGFVIEASGKPEETEAILKALEPFGVKEMTRTGRIVLHRGSTVLDPFLQQQEAVAQAAAAHGTGGQAMTGADMVPRILAEQGVEVIFGYSGGAILPTIDAIYRYNAENPKKTVRMIVPANEQGAAFMASGYSRSTGKVGVALVTSGPGATNTVTPVRDAMADSVPMVVLCGQVPRPAMGTDAFQEAPVFNIMSSCAKHVFLVEKPEELEATLRTAFEIARTGRPGPVVVDLPKDVQNWKGSFFGTGKLPLPGYRWRLEQVTKSRVSKESMDAFFAALKASEKPLIYAGGGVINANAADELREFSRTFNIPVVTTLMGIGGMDTKDPLAMHMLGMHGTAYANYAVEDCDFLFTVGARFDDRVAGKVKEFAPNAKFIGHLDVDAAEIGKVKAVNWSHVADAKQGLKDLIAGGKSLGFKKDFSPWIQHVQDLKKKYPLNYDRKSALIQPYYVIETLTELTKGDAIITTGVGQHQMWAAQYAHHKAARNFITSGSMGTMGFGLPAAIGAAFANPGKTVIDIDGDGSIRMNFGELETITTYGLKVKVLLLNNEGDGMVRQWQTVYYGGRYFAIDKNLHSMNFVKAAEAASFPFSKSIKNPGDVKETLKAFLESDGPAFLEVMIDPFAPVYPMVGPGAGYKEMLTGDWITSRDGKKPVVAAAANAPVPELF